MKKDCCVLLWTIILLILLCSKGLVLNAQISPQVDSNRGLNPIKIRLDVDRLAHDSVGLRWKTLALLNTRRVLNDWWPSYKVQITENHIIDFGYLENNSKTGDFGPETKGGIRPAAQNAYALAVCIFTGIYDEKFIGVPIAEAIQSVVTIVRSIAKDHLSNGGIGHSWGNQWQSSQWASKCAVAGWLLEGSFSVTDQQYIVRMLEYEADRLLAIPAPSANEDYVLNTHAEENGWDATCLQTAVGVMPEHPRADDWLKQSLAYRLNALATPVDLMNNDLVRDKAIKDWINGYNLDTLGALGNHQAYPHPDYMASPLRHAIEGAIFLKLGMVGVPETNFFNCERVYDNLTNYPWEGSGKIYQSNGQISWPIDQEQDWRFEYMTYGVVDAGAYLFHYDQNSTGSALSWEEKHSRLALDMELMAFTSASAFLLHWLFSSDAW